MGMPSPAERPEPGPTPHHGKPVPFSLRKETRPQLPATLWRLGVFYVNHEDPSVVVPQRFGVGWAMNWGNPRSWGLVALFVAAIAVFVVVIELLV